MDGKQTNGDQAAVPVIAGLAQQCDEGGEFAVLAGDHLAPVAAVEAATAAEDAELLHGTEAGNSDGALVFEAAHGFADSDSFAWMATDGSDSSALATMSITVGDKPAKRSAGTYDALGTN